MIWFTRATPWRGDLACFRVRSANVTLQLYSARSERQPSARMHQKARSEAGSAMDKIFTDWRLKAIAGLKIPQVLAKPVVCQAE
jgi:hypothetical protein